MANLTNALSSLSLNKDLNVVSRAKMLGYYSVDEHRNYLPDSSRLLYINPPNLNRVTIDLNKDIETAIRHPPMLDKYRLALLLKWIKDNLDKIKPPPGIDRWIRPNFVCTSSCLVKLLAAPYSDIVSWRMYAAKWKGTIYLSADETVFSCRQFKEYTGRDVAEKKTSWAYKFEQYVLSDSPDSAPDTSRPMIEYERFRCVYQHCFGKHMVLYSAVMQGVCSNEKFNDPLPLEKLKFIDLKTCHSSMMHYYHEKYLKKRNFLRWWINGFLANTETVLCAFRNDEGIVKKMTTYSLDKIIPMSEEYWNPSECLNFCETLLTKFAEAVVNDCDETIYLLEKTSYDNFHITELTASKENSVLPPSYMAKME